MSEQHPFTDAEQRSINEDPGAWAGAPPRQTPDFEEGMEPEAPEPVGVAGHGQGEPDPRASHYPDDVNPAYVEALARRVATLLMDMDRFSAEADPPFEAPKASSLSQGFQPLDGRRLAFLNATDKRLTEVRAALSELRKLSAPLGNIRLLDAQSTQFQTDTLPAWINLADIKNHFFFSMLQLLEDLESDLAQQLRYG